MAADLVHATVIAAAGRAALIRGPSGSGKSDLALRCLALGRNPLLPAAAHLLCDDQVRLQRDGDRLLAFCPPNLSGKIEVRGLGILPLPPPDFGAVPVALVVDLTPDGVIDRFPDPWPETSLLGVSVPVLLLNPFESSAPLKLLLALGSTNLPLGG